MKKLLRRYVNTVRGNCMQESDALDRNVDYWRDYLFARLVEWVLPLSLLSIFPSIAYTISQGVYEFAIYDVIFLSILLYVAFGKNISGNNRKLLYMTFQYCTAVLLLIYVGAAGPGQLFLYTACIQGLLILSNRYAYLWSWLNLVGVIIFAIVLQFQLSPMEAANNFDVVEWLVISTNLIFLSFLSSALIPQVFYGLSVTFRSHQDLQKKLSLKNKEQKQLLIELKEKNTELEQFAYIASHDLQEPLRMIGSFMGLLQKNHADKLDEKANQYIHFAVDGAKRMKAIILDLLEYSRAGKPDQIAEEISIPEVLEGYAELRRDTIEQKSAQIKYNDLPVISGFRLPLVQALYNLIDNALKYSKEDDAPNVVIYVNDKGEDWLFSVKDNGIGIEERFFERIFIMFQRLHNKDEYHGTGIGLAIVKKNIESMNGKIWVESVKGEGSTFHFTVPKLPSSVQTKKTGYE